MSTGKNIDLNKSGGVINPFMAQDNATSVLAFNKWKQKTEAECKQKIDDLNKILVEAAEQATNKDGDLDFTLLKIWGNNVQDKAGKIMDIHSEMCGVQSAYVDMIKSRAATERAKQIAVGNHGGEDMDGFSNRHRNDPVYQRYSDMMEAAMQEDHGFGFGPEFAKAFRAGNVQFERPISAKMTPDQVRAAAFSTTSWDPFYQRRDGFTPILYRPIQVYEVLPTFPASSDTVSWMEETTNTQSAAELAELATAAESAFALTERTSNVVRIAHTLPISEEALADESQVRPYIDMRMPEGVRLRTESQFFNGDASGSNLKGLFAYHTAAGNKIQTQKYVIAAGAVTKPWNVIRKARTKIRFPGRATPTHALLHPDFWEQAVLSESSSGGFYVGGPQSPMMDRAWGFSVIESDLFTNDKSADLIANHKFGGVFGDFTGMYCGLWIRHGVRVETGLSDTQFKKFAITVRASIRAAVTFERAHAFVGLVNPKADGSIPTDA